MGLQGASQLLHITAPCEPFPIEYIHTHISTLELMRVSSIYKMHYCEYLAYDSHKEGVLDGNVIFLQSMGVACNQAKIVRHHFVRLLLANAMTTNIKISHDCAPPLIRELQFNIMHIVRSSIEGHSPATLIITSGGVHTLFSHLLSRNLTPLTRKSTEVL